MTQHNHAKQAVSFWSIQVLYVLDPRVSREIAVTMVNIKSVLLSRNEM